MVASVRDIMNKDIFSLRPNDTVETARNGIVALGITAAPILDESRRPIGIVSLRDLGDVPQTDTVEQRMSSPVSVVPVDGSVGDVASRLAESKLRHLVVVDGAGRAIGMVSAGDVLRSLLGLPASHPAPVPPELKVPELKWSNEASFDLDSALTRAPLGPGLIQLTTGDETERHPIWFEAAESVRSRLVDMLSSPHDLNGVLKAWIERDLFHLGFRVALLADPERRARAAQELQRNLHLGSAERRA